MKFTLKTYQEAAVKEVLTSLQRARRFWREDGDKSAFSLTAATGAGKTVMAAAIFEALFYGNEEDEQEPDPSAVVIWFSDDPALNMQSSWRLHEASDKLTTSDLRVVENSFNREKFEAGKVYFLNTQKLSRSSLLVRGHELGDRKVEMTADGQRIMPNLRAYTIWDTIQNTIEDQSLTLYLLLDEAHRGMRENAKSGVEGKLTIVKQLINGAGSVPGIPIVLGISATVERFDTAVREMQGRIKLPSVIVDPREVQSSGLVKDTINLDIPEGVGDFATVLVRRGTDKLREISIAWAEYAKQTGDAEPVLPLLILQVPNTPDPNEVSKWLDTIFKAWPELDRACLANVFGDHRTETFGTHSAPYISPERVQESSNVRVLIAKDAISTGWDCPRAEVMVSFRAATDRTHITQLLGRMVRTPLARRIPGDDRLNAVHCLLPHFDRKSVEAVVKLLNGGEGEESGEGGGGRRVLINAVQMNPNPSIPEDVWQSLLLLPSQSIPRRHAKPVKRLTLLAHELAEDGLLPDAGKTAHADLHKVLDGLRARFAEEIATARTRVLEVEGQTGRADVHSSTLSFDRFVEHADYAVIEDAYRRAARAYSPDLARTYAEHLAERVSDAGDEEGGLIDAHTAIAAMGLVVEIKRDLEEEAEKFTAQWLSRFRVSMKGLGDDRQEVYRQIREMSTTPSDLELAKPRTLLQATAELRVDGSESPLKTYDRHLLCDADGMFPGDFNRWEKDVIAAELGRPDTVAWYRNPARAGQDSLGILYEDGQKVGTVRPDFIVFSRLANGEVGCNIVDPHGTHLRDALPKIRGLARYAETNAGVVRRVEAVAALNGKYRTLDLTEKVVRDAVRNALSASDLYSSEAASDYRNYRGEIVVVSTD